MLLDNIINFTPYDARSQLRVFVNYLLDLPDEFFVVGGAVRNALLFQEIDDIDIATSGDPERIYAHLTEGKYACYRTGIKFGTIGAVIQYGPNNAYIFRVEITTFRSEVYDGLEGYRHPSVIFGTHVDADLARRDFTINAIAFNLRTNTLYDPCHGAEDLKNKQLVCVGSAKDRFAEDNLRVFRAVRFASKYNLQVSAEICKEIANLTTLHLAHERIADEFRKMMKLPMLGRARALSYLAVLNLAKWVFPACEPMLDFMDATKNESVYYHSVRVINNLQPAPSLTLIYAALLHDCAKPYTSDPSHRHFYGHEEMGANIAEETCLNYLFTGAQMAKDVANLVRLHMRRVNFNGGPSAYRRLAQEAGSQIFSLLNLMEADVLSSKESHSDFLLFEAKLLKAKDEIELAPSTKNLSPLTGDQIMSALHIQPGKMVGIIKKGLEELVLEGVLSADPEFSYEQSIAIAKQLMIARNTE